MIRRMRIKMKKLLFFLISIVLASSITAFAGDPQIDKATVATLVGNYVFLRDAVGNRDIKTRNNDLIVIEKYKGLIVTAEARRVEEGYGADVLKSMIYSTFTKSVADRIVNGSEYLFDRYVVRDGKEYYVVYPETDGSVLTNLEVDVVPAVSFPVDAAENARLVTEEGGSAYFAVKCDVSQKITTYPVVDGFPQVGNPKQYDFARKPEAEVLFKFALEDGNWKIAAVDFSQTVFSANGTDGLDGGFTAETFKKLYGVCVQDLYYYANRQSALKYLFTGSYATRFFDESNAKDKDWRYRYIPEENLEDPDVWRAYAGKYCSAEIAERLTGFERGLKVVDGRVNKTVNNIVAHEDSIGFIPQFFDGSDIVSLTADDNHAEVTYLFTAAVPELKVTAEAITLEKPENVSERDRIEMTFVFDKVGGTWKVTGGDFIEKLDSCFKAAEPAPSTGDRGPAVLLCLAAAAILLSAAFRKRLVSR